MDTQLIRLFVAPSIQAGASTSSLLHHNKYGTWQKWSLYKYIYIHNCLQKYIRRYNVMNHNILLENKLSVQYATSLNIIYILYSITLCPNLSLLISPSHMATSPLQDAPGSSSWGQVKRVAEGNKSYTPEMPVMPGWPESPPRFLEIPWEANFKTLPHLLTLLKIEVDTNDSSSSSEIY